MKKNRIGIFCLVAVMALVISACSTVSSDVLTATGTFSAVDTNISSEVSGKVLEVFVNEGDEITEGQPLFQLDDEFSRAQLDQASAAVKVAEAAVELATQQAASAEAQYQLALQASLAADLPTRQAVLSASTADDYRPAWYFNKTELIEAAQTQVDNAQETLNTALRDLEKEQKDASSKDFLAAEKRLAAAQNALSVTETTQNLTSSTDENLEDAAQELLDDAQTEFDSALADYDKLLTTSAAETIVQARARVTVAQTNLDSARSALLALQTGDQSLQVIAAQKAYEAASAGVKQAQAGLEQAKQAEKLTQLQFDRTTVKSPISGVVLTRSIEIGDLAVAGGSVMRVAQLDTLKLVVYLPEDQYGKVNVGDLVNITVDSFSGEVFRGTITNIADEAEFTPRNVQTDTGRKATVYAVKIEITNTDHQLKPGMPADVEFKIK